MFWGLAFLDFLAIRLVRLLLHQRTFQHHTARRRAGLPHAQSARLLWAPLAQPQPADGFGGAFDVWRLAAPPPKSSVGLHPCHAARRPVRRVTAVAPGLRSLGFEHPPDCRQATQVALLALAVGGWRLAVGGWRLAVGGWRLAASLISLAGVPTALAKSLKKWWALAIKASASMPKRPNRGGVLAGMAPRLAGCTARPWYRPSPGIPPSQTAPLAQSRW